MADLSVFMRGNKIVVRGEWRVPNTAGALTDPTTVTFTARLRGAAATPYVYAVDAEVTRVSVGIFEFARVPAEGTWSVHAQGTGAAYAAGEIEFVIDHSRALA